MHVNPASKKILGILPKTLIGRSVFDFIHIDDQKKVSLELDALKSNRKVVNFSPFRYKNVNGDWRWIEAKGTNLLDFQSINGIVFCLKDITKRVENEFKFIESAKRSMLLSGATSDAIRDVDILKNVVVWSNAINRVFKHKNIDKNEQVDWWKEMIHPEDKKRVLIELNYNVRNRISRWEVEYRFQCGNGTFKYVLDRILLIFNLKGKLVRLIGAMQDISKRKEEEGWSKLLESVVINTTDGVLIIDANTNPKASIIFVNDSFVSRCGYSRTELMGKSPSLLLGKNVNQNGLKILSEAFKQQKGCMIELLNYTKSGEEYCVSINVAPVLDSKGKLTHWISIQRDITKDKQYVKAIEEQNQKLMEIAWMHSHCLRAPMAKILALVDLIKIEECIQEQQKLLNFLSTSVCELDKLIQETGT